MRRTMRAMAVAIVLLSLSAGATVAGSPSKANAGTLDPAETVARPGVELTVQPVATFDASTGSVTLKGTIKCSGGAIVGGALDVSARQRVGKSLVEGGNSYSLGCDEITRIWSVEIFGESSVFKRGRAVVSVFASACTELLCGDDLAQLTVGVRR